MSVAPMKYAERTALGQHLIDEDHDLLVDAYRGFTPSGTFVNPCLYTIFHSTDGGVDYYAAINGSQIIYGGVSTANHHIGGVDGASLAAVTTAARADMNTSGGLLYFWDGQTETYLSPTTVKLYPDIWGGGTSIYSAYRWKMGLCSPSAERLFAVSFELDVKDRTGGDTVVVYTQVIDDIHTTADTWGFNTVVAKTGDHKATAAEFDVNTYTADDDPATETKPCAGVNASSGGTNKPFVAYTAGCNSTAAAWQHLFRGVDVWAYSGITLRPTVSNPAGGYITTISAVDDLNPGTSVFSHQSSAYKQLFGITKKGSILMDTVAAGKLIEVSALGDIGIGFNISNITDTLSLLTLTNAGLMALVNYILVATATSPIIDGRTAGNANPQVLLEKTQLSFGNGTDAVDASITRTGAGAITTNTVWRATGFKSNDGTAGATDDVIVRDAAGTGTTTLSFKNGLFVGHT
jgi:hypothetical protein